jgi:hypothetical protein
MQTNTTAKAKLSLNKRTIVLLNEHNMNIMNGGTDTKTESQMYCPSASCDVGCHTNELRCTIGYPVTKNPNDIKCGANKSNACTNNDRTQ